MLSFFTFTKTKFIVFVLLCASFLYYTSSLDSILGNGSLLVYGVGIVAIYLFVGIIWLALKGFKYFLMGLVLLALLGLAGWVTGEYSSGQRAKALSDCMRENNTDQRTTEVYRCLGGKGYRLYR